VLAWNDLGMHCMAPDFVVFTILPPFNTLQALEVTYESSPDASGSINTTPIGKTDFWESVGLIFGISPPPDTGIAGYSMPGLANTPQDMEFEQSFSWFTGEGQQLTTTRAVAPVSTELECSACHGSNGSPFAMPAGGWSLDPDPLQDDRWNILCLHDERHVGEPSIGDTKPRVFRTRPHEHLASASSGPEMTRHGGHRPSTSG
jgi:hypothetical protein